MQQMSFVYGHSEAIGQMSNRANQLARSTVLRHPLGAELKTPLLVPSFSSKGFDFDDNNVSEINGIFEVAKELITDTMLLSAYDLHYKHLPDIQHAIPQITFLDSGGYEVSPGHDLSTVYHSRNSHDVWNASLLDGVLSRWPAHVPTVLVNFDDGTTPQTITDQLSAARDLFNRYPKQLHCILIKPEPGQKYVPIEQVIGHINELSAFSIIGITEKELGKAMLDRMHGISRIRFALDDNGITAPIHVFGSLDPISSVLYFLSGAEIFDGLTWLRYGYHNGLAIYPQNFGNITVGITKLVSHMRADMLSRNINYLTELEMEMRIFAIDGTFEKFSHNAELFGACYDKLRSKQVRIQ
jgi:hypothetical protein